MADEPVPTTAPIGQMVITGDCEIIPAEVAAGNSEENER